MIKQLIIKNFQSHKDTKLEFSPGVNVIVGSSDSGKTAILRALRWLITNRPSGDAFRRWDTDETYVRIDFTDGEWVSRTKSKTENKYKSIGKTYKALGTDVPEEVENILNLNAINISRQLDAPFLLSDSPGEVAQHFNRIAHLDVIDSGIKKIQSLVRSLGISVDQESDRISKLTEELESYSFIEKFEIELEVIEEAQKQLSQVSNRKNKLASLVENKIDIHVDIQMEERILVVESSLNVILEDLKKNKSLKEKRENLDLLLLKNDAILDSMTDEENIIEADTTITNILETMKRRSKYETKSKTLNNLLLMINSIKISIRETEAIKLKREEEFNNLMPDICPLCGK